MIRELVDATDSYGEKVQVMRMRNKRESYRDCNNGENVGEKRLRWLRTTKSLTRFDLEKIIPTDWEKGLQPAFDGRRIGSPLVNRGFKRCFAWFWHCLEVFQISCLIILE